MAVLVNSKQFRNPISGSFTGSFVGNLSGTSSYASTASYADNFTINNSLTASGSINFTGSMLVTGSIRLASGGAITAPTITYQTSLLSNGGELVITQNQIRNDKNGTIVWGGTAGVNSFRDVGVRRNTSGSVEIYDGITADGTIANRRDLIARNITGSLSGSADFATSSSYAATSSFANNFTVAGTLTAQTIVVQTISSSVAYASGSNIFGSLLTNTHSFTGSVGVTGSLTVNSSSIIGNAANNGGRADIGLSVITNINNSAISVTNQSGTSFHIENANQTVNSYVNIGLRTDNGGNAIYSNISLIKTSSSVGALRIHQQGVQQLGLFTSTGNLVLQNGGTFTDNGYRLQVNGPGSASGSLFVSGSSSFTGSVGISGSINVNNTLYVSASNVGINNLTPSQSLDVVGNIRSTGPTGGTLEFYDTTTTANGPAVISKIVGSSQINHGSGYLGFFTTINGTQTEWIRLDRNGNLSIGKTTANTPLDILGNTTITGSLTVTGSSVFSGSVTSTIGFTGSLSGSVTHAFTSSYADNFTVGNTLTAQRIVVQTISSSVAYASGSNIFGSDLTNTQTFTGSVGITGSLSINNSLVVTGSVTAAGAIARSTYINPTLIASANSDVLVGLDINPTFNTGSFTGVGNYALRVTGPSLFTQLLRVTGPAASQDAYYGNDRIDVYGSSDYAIKTNNGSLTLSTATTGIILFRTNNTERARFFNSGNFTIQNGGTFTDNGYRLQVNGSGSVSGSLFVSGSSVFSGSVNISGSLITTGTITAQTLLVQTITSSISYLTGSTQHGSLLSNTHQFTGSVGITGSLIVNGPTTIVSASLNYQENLAVTTGSFQTITSAATGSFRSAFFDYVAFSGSVVRAGTVISTWSGSVTEYYENYTNDLGGSTAVVTLQTAISASNIVLQAGISGSAWSVRSLVRLL
jgi:hypothetical protein